MIKSHKLYGQNLGVLLYLFNRQSFASFPTKYIYSVDLVRQLFPGLLQW